MIIPGKFTKEMKETHDLEEALKEAKEDALSKVNPHRDSLLAVGFNYGENTTIQCDNGSQNNLTGMVIKADFLTFPLYWRTYENNIIEIADKEALNTLSNAMMGFVQQVFNASWSVKDNIANAYDVPTVERFISEYLGGDV